MRYSSRQRGLIAINLAAVIFGTAALYGKLEVSATWIALSCGLILTASFLLLRTGEAAAANTAAAQLTHSGKTTAGNKTGNG